MPYLLLLTIFAATLGELGRIPESLGPTYLINDLFVPILIVIWILKKITIDREFKVPPLMPAVTAWAIIAAFSLLLNTSWLETPQLKEGALYLVRFISYFFLYLIAYDEIRKNERNRKILLGGILSGALLIAIFGFIQLKLFPSFFELGMEEEGWDPHIGRLLSTWFDPNFVGGFLGFIVCLLFGLILKSKKKGIYIILMPIILAALYLTYSRSAYLACLIGLLVITGIKSRKLLIAALFGGAAAFFFLAQIQPRFMDLWETIQSMAGLNEYAKLFNPDATSRLRLGSWNNAIAVIKEHFWFGSGYNTFKFAQWKLGLLQDLEAHHGAGSDSTLLTIFATTGLFGITAYLWFYLKAFLQSAKQSPGIAGGLVALLAHSTFVNTLLFPHILIFFWITLALSAKIPSKSRNRITS
ncbi:MAG: O-antigen ligase family protein [Patescibacteria group bacterium]|nr:O-antigen ligase family protein [Patescibacteria group bacterium]